MKRFTRQATWLGCVVGGVALASLGSSSLQSSGDLRSDRNPFALQRSAYGRLFARLSETTVDRIWHLGVEQVAPHQHSGHDHGEGCNHEHCNHPSHATGEAQVKSSHDHGAEHEHHHEHEHEHEQGHDHDHGHEHPASMAASEASASNAQPHSSVLERCKGWFAGMQTVTTTRTNPRGISERHLATVRQDVEELLLRSYRMDPTHYGAYNSYHLFLTTHDFGGTPETREHARKVAKATLANVSGEDEDPVPWLTAAAAAMNLYQLEITPYRSAGDPIPLEMLKKHRSRVAHCLARFGKLQQRAERRGTWQNLSHERQLQIARRHRFASRTFEQFDAMIARRKEKAPDAAPDGEVAGSTPREDR